MIADCGHIFTSFTAQRRLDEPGHRRTDERPRDDEHAGPRPAGTQVLNEHGEPTADSHK